MTPEGELRPICVTITWTCLCGHKYRMVRERLPVTGSPGEVPLCWRCCAQGIFYADEDGTTKAYLVSHRRASDEP